VSDAVEIPGLRLDVTANSRLHWAARAKRVKRQRAIVGLMLRSVDRPTLPCVVTITRRSPGTLDDDNAVSSAKAVRDAVAQWLGVDDRSPLVTWRVEQERGPWGVRVAVRGVAAPAGAADGAGLVTARVTPVARPHGAAAGDGGAVAKGATRR